MCTVCIDLTSSIPGLDSASPVRAGRANPPREDLRTTTASYGRFAQHAFRKRYFRAEPIKDKRARKILRICISPLKHNIKQRACKLLRMFISTLKYKSAIVRQLSQFRAEPLAVSRIGVVRASSRTNIFKNVPSKRLEHARHSSREGLTV